MNANALLDLIGDARGQYVWDAEVFRSGQCARNASRKKIRLYWLIAAVVALTMLLVGCAVAYFLNLENLQVGSHASPGDEGAYLSLQNANQEAMAEWIDFRQSYDTDGSILAEYDADPSGFSEVYHFTYGCYSQEMVDKLEEIADKYDLKLLTKAVDFQYYEHSVLFDALKIEGLIQKNAQVEVEYGSGYFYQEGTFDIGMLIGPYEGAEQKFIVSFHYSLKSYFDPVVVFFTGELADYEQWNAALSDGSKVLLATDGEFGRIFADLGDGFISIHLECVEEGAEISKAQLEELAQWFSYSVSPKTADMEEVEALLSAARAAHTAEMESEQAAFYQAGYEGYVEKLLQKGEENPRLYASELITYALYDVNADGTADLIVRIRGALHEIVSIREGECFSYFDAKDIPALPAIYVCENSVIEIYDSMSGFRYYFQAGEEGADFLTGLYIIQHAEDPHWQRVLEMPPSGDESQWKLEDISEQEAEQIIESHKRVDLDWKPLTDFPLG